MDSSVCLDSGPPQSVGRAFCGRLRARTVPCLSHLLFRGHLPALCDIRREMYTGRNPWETHPRFTILWKLVVLSQTCPVIWGCKSISTKEDPLSRCLNIKKVQIEIAVKETLFLPCCLGTYTFMTMRKSRIRSRFLRLLRVYCRNW